MNDTAADAAISLRPLGIGEIFDRAVTLYVRNFVLFAIIAAFLVVPLSIANYFVVAQGAGSFAQILDQIQHPTHASSPASLGAFGPWFFVVILVSFFLSPFMYVAMAAAVARVYKGEMPDWRTAYGVALRHAASIIGMTFCQLLTLAGAGFAGGIALVLAFTVAVLLVRFVTPLGVALVVLSIVLFLIYFIALMLCYLAIALAFDAIGIEEARFGRAFSSGFARIFNRSEIGKAALICLAFIAVQLALTIVIGVGNGLIETFVRLPILQTAFQGAASLVTSGFLGVLLAVYYFDVRVRREGLDMQAAIEQLQVQP